jgi:hypothetical protein
MYMKNTFLLLSWLILLPSGILANPIKEMLGNYSVMGARKRYFREDLVGCCLPDSCRYRLPGSAKLAR